MSDIKVAVFPAGEPREGEWVVAWQTPSMPGPAFYYFKTVEQAAEAAVSYLTGQTITLEEVKA